MVFLEATWAVAKIGSRLKSNQHKQILLACLNLWNTLYLIRSWKIEDDFDLDEPQLSLTSKAEKIGTPFSVQVTTLLKSLLEKPYSFSFENNGPSGFCDGKTIKTEKMKL